MGNGKGRKRRGKLSTPCFVYEAARMHKHSVFLGSAYAFLQFSNLSRTLSLDNKYTMVMRKLQHNTDQIALTIVKISSIHSVAFLKIQSCVKIAPQFEKNLNYGLLFCKHNGTF